MISTLFWMKFEYYYHVKFQNLPNYFIFNFINTFLFHFKCYFHSIRLIDLLCFSSDSYHWFIFYAFRREWVAEKNNPKTPLWRAPISFVCVPVGLELQHIFPLSPLTPLYHIFEYVCVSHLIGTPENRLKTLCGTHIYVKWVNIWTDPEGIEQPEPELWSLEPEPHNFAGCTPPFHNREAWLPRG